MRIPANSLWLKALLFLSVSFSGCAYRDFVEEPVPTEQGTDRIAYPLALSLKPGITGSFSMIKLTDGTARGELTLQGYDPAKRYFANISQSNANDFGSAPVVADLHEITSSTGKSATWLHVDYLNRPLLFDSLASANAMIKVFEFDPAKNDLSVEVLRGDIGGNLLTQETQSLTIVPVAESGVQGSVLFTKRQNGNLFIQTELTGLNAQNTATQSLYIGDLSEAYTSFKRLSQVSGQTGKAISSLSGYTFEMLDTLKGFVGIGYSPAQPDSIIAYANFGGNQSTGRSKAIDIYNTADSTLAGQITFTERSGGSLQMTWLFAGIPTGVDHFITFHKNSAFHGPDTAHWCTPITVTAGQQGLWNRPTSIYGNPLRFDELDSINSHIILTTDTTSFAAIQAQADMGGNRLTGNNVRVEMPSLDAANFPIQSAFTVIRERASGKVLMEMTVENTLQFFQHPFNIRQGQASATQGPLLLNIAILNGTGGQIKQSFEPTQYLDGTPLNYLSLSAGVEKYLELEYNDEGSGAPPLPMCGGNLP